MILIIDEISPLVRGDMGIIFIKNDYSTNRETHFKIL